MRSRLSYTLMISFLIVITGLCFFLYRYRVHKSFQFPIDTVGNTAGNIRGEGLFCEYQGKVYFSNAYDQGALYVMNPDCTDIKCLSSTKVSYLNAGGKYLFYYTDGVKGGTGLGYIRSMAGLYRCSLKGTGFCCLDDTISTMSILAGNHIYYQHYDNKNFSTFHRLAIDDSGENEFLQKSVIETACAANGTLYYSGTEKDHYVYGYDLTTGNSRRIWIGNTCYPTIIGQYIYYLDIDLNYQLCRYDMNSNTITVLTTDRVDSYNIFDSVIFYQKNDPVNPALIRMTLDGTQKETVAEGIFHRINTTSTYTYFYPFGEDSIVYRTNTYGPTVVDSFPEALQAALSKK